MESDAESLQQAPPVAAEPGGPECAPPRPGRVGRAVKFCRRLGAAGPLALIQVLLPGVGGVVLFGTIARVAPLVRHTWWGPPAAVAVYSVLGGAALLPTFVFSVFAGWAFGFVVGLVTALLGFAGAAAVSFAYSGWMTGRRALEVVDANPRWRAVHRALLHSGRVRAMWIVALLRLPSLPPFGATTVALAAMRVRWGPFLVGTVLGTVPRTAAYVYLASRAKDLAEASGNRGWMFVVSCLAAVGALGVLALLTLIARRILASLTT